MKTTAAAVEWIIAKWSANLEQILELMTAERPQTSVAPAGTVENGDGWFWWEQKANIGAGAPVWIGAPEAAWKDLGTRTLQAAGIDEVSVEDAQSTYQEILSQTLSGLAKALSSQLEQAVDFGAGISQGPPQSFETVVAVTIQYGSGALEPVRVAMSRAMLEAVEASLSSEQAVAIPDRSVAETPAERGPSPMDLLLDVEMPVTISFGRSYLALRDILKLTTGSIVELDRAINDYVEVIVNNCVIAKGEVVVIDGNYGVRIHEVVSRQERLAVRNAASQTPPFKMRAIA